MTSPARPNKQSVLEARRIVGNYSAEHLVEKIASLVEQAAALTAERALRAQVEQERDQALDDLQAIALAGEEPR